ncbi:hypothetical protein NL676_013820 [Syzygium grande]|nr:hypothetical protein NL676_013820 [Syzygium grande]
MRGFSMAIVSVFRPDLGIWALRKSKNPRSMVTSKSHRSSGKSGNPMSVATGGVESLALAKTMAAYGEE